MITFDEMKKEFNLSDEVFNVLKKANIKVSIDISVAHGDDEHKDTYSLWAYSERQMWNWVDKLMKMPEVARVTHWFNNGAYVCDFELK